MKIKELLKKFKANDSSYIKLRDYYETPSYLEILGVDRKEIVHSQFLAWLFNLNKDTNENTPIYLLIKYLFRMSKLEISFSVGDVVLNHIGTEKGDKNRIDMFIRVTVLNKIYSIVLENKVYSVEYNQQTSRYVAEFENKKDVLFFYLISAPNKKANKENHPDIHQDFVIINYQGLLDYVITPLKYKEVQIEFVLNEYVRCLSKSWRYYKKRNQNNHNVMALNQEHRELLNDFWEDNKDLILLALQAITEDDGFSEEVQNEVQETVDILKEHREKQSNKYVLEYEGKQSHSFLLVDVVRQVLEFTKGNITLNDSIFDYFFENDNYNSFSLVIKKSGSLYNKNISRYGKKDSFVYKKKGDRTSYACLRNWGTNNIEPFKLMLKEKFKIELKAIN